VIAFVNKIQVCSFATVDGDKPRVRYMMPFRADENGFIFTTGKFKDIHGQLQANPSVELCFWDQAENRQVRIAGRAELVDDIDLKKEILEKFQFLKPWVEREGYEAMAVYRVCGETACTWVMETNFDPKEAIEM